MIPRTFSARERREIDELPADARRARFFEIWTLKESYLKALGVGLEPELDSFEFSLGQGRKLTASIPGESPWSFSLYQPDAFHRLALAYNATARTAIIFRKQVDHDTSEPDENCVLLAQSAPRS